MAFYCRVDDRVKRSNAAELADPMSLFALPEIRASFSAMVCVCSSWRCHGRLHWLHPSLASLANPPRDGRFVRRTMSHSGLECDGAPSTWNGQSVGHDGLCMCMCLCLCLHQPVLISRAPSGDGLRKSVSPNRDLLFSNTARIYTVMQSALLHVLHHSIHSWPRLVLAFASLILQLTLFWVY